MVAMRLASEQQLQDCLSHADASRRSGASPPSVEVLMTLLWAITCIEKEMGQATPKLDAAAELDVRQSEMELQEWFRPRVVSERRISFVQHGRDAETALAKKSLDGWRLESKHDRP